MRTCAVMLLPNDLIWSRLNQSLPLLKQNLLDKYTIDYVIFHEAGFSEANKNEIRRRVSDVIFKEIKFNMPESAQGFKPLWSDDWSLEKCTSYGGMCTFFTKDIFEILIEMGYDYYLRLDDDSYLYEDFKENPFEKIRRENKSYGYCLKIKEGPHVIQGLFPFIKQHVETDYVFEEPHWIYYNNFEIVDIKRYYNDQIREISQKIHESGGIYHWRWGDAPIRTILVSIFLPDEVMEFDIDYEHQEIRNKK
jgi:alpha 1,2-mannosyltransferase